MLKQLVTSNFRCSPFGRSRVQASSHPFSAAVTLSQDAFASLQVNPGSISLIKRRMSLFPVLETVLAMRLSLWGSVVCFPACMGGSLTVGQVPVNPRPHLFLQLDFDCLHRDTVVGTK